MTDTVDGATRSRMMAGIRGRDTKPELLIRSLLYHQGFRFRLHAKGLPGKPDILLPRYNAVIFVHGCFWHRHDCRLFRLPGTRKEFWLAKLERNAERDQKTREALLAAGWRVGVVWECAIRGSTTDPVEVVKSLARWLNGKNTMAEWRA